MFYLYNQNNSGGSFDVDEEVSEYVFVEANNAEEANEKAKEIGIYFNGVEEGNDCECCGSRWYEADESDGSAEPTLYGEPIRECVKSYFRNEAIIHYANGTKEKIKFQGA